VEWKDGLPGFPTAVPPKGGLPVDLGLSLSPTPSVRLEYPPKGFSSAPWSYLRRRFSFAGMKIHWRRLKAAGPMGIERPG
jgi:hypothetical protein